MERHGCVDLSRSYVSVGLVAWDDCNQLTVGPERIYRSISFPLEANDREWCDFGGLIAIPLLISLTRCAPTQDDAGNPPTEDELQKPHASILHDAAVLWNVAVGELPDDEWERAAVSQSFAGNSGGIIAIETRLTVGIDQALWCP